MKRFIEKLVACVLCVLLCFSTIPLVACGADITLVVYNCQEYIDEELIEEFETEYQDKHGKSLKVQYDTFDTLENMYANIKINPNTYDVVCPSDYMIEKMAREGMLEELSLNPEGEYNTYVSPFITEKFSNITWGENNEHNLAKYSAGYMWGTLGLVYNPQNVNENDMESWASLWNSKYSGKFSIKDSVRDTYFIGLAKKYQTELQLLKSTYELNNDLTIYQMGLKSYFNDTEINTINAVKSELFALKDASRAMEVDNGKDMIIKGDTDVYFAWSGDAVYAMDIADESGVTLKYSVPKEGSNVWFDGWCVIKNSAKKDVAQEFIDFMSRPSNVIRNMEFIGYVSCIGGSEIFNWVSQTYGETGGANFVDLGYFFRGDGDSANYTLGFSEKNRQFSAQYPDQSVINRCVVMNYFNDTANENINLMWQEIKSH